ncbi:Epoxide hydrolase A [Bienertia sinuspersici]
MEEIKHRTLQVNDIKIHIAEKGEGPVVLLLHGFPELWYTWRHQITALASNGYHAIAPDLRGYGDSDSPPCSSSYTCFHLVGDIIGLLDLLNVDQVYLVAHDMGAMVGWYLCMFRPDRIKAFACLSLPFRPRNPKLKPVQTFRAFFGGDYYICRFQEPGDIEAEINKYGVRHVLLKILTSRDPGAPMLPKGKAFEVSPDNPLTLPSWLSEEDINYYASKYEDNGFTGPLNHYRTLDWNWELTAPWTGTEVNVPTKLLVGDVDMVYNMVGVKQYVHEGGFKKDVPLLEDTVVMEGVGHFINQEKAEEVNQHIIDFFNKF